ncbi:hypothetical protein C2R22_18770 [Salinigranum rubrum]|uniref:Uncharacterized protein n=1 Tax=Salinigranum rubrum TaxID=755307 RepID=A0A2I8VNI3_9EURY|nr:hypothetical protein [Salinigranum rubrum]AUV83434.1 hypothetical protein C2R22_18770 [Salinigranum rubrum]
MTASGPVDTGPTDGGEGRPTTGSDILAPARVDVLDLVEDPEAFEALVSEGTSPLAVIGEPFSGRDAVLDATSDRLGATRLRLGPGDGVGVVRKALDDGPVVVGGVTTSSPGESAASNRSSSSSGRSHGPTRRS